ncbi:MAG: hypothetical protein MPK75_04455 [Alphaproteobacteria bacterium]|nr:hypothetical protein [Alphaproteobacteria bacterium]
MMIKDSVEQPSALVGEDSGLAAVFAQASDAHCRPQALPAKNKFHSPLPGDNDGDGRTVNQSLSSSLTCGRHNTAAVVGVSPMTPYGRRRRSGFTVVEALGVVVIGVVFTAFTFSMLSRQLESDRAQDLASALRLTLDAGAKYTRANLGTDTFQEMEAGRDGAIEICVEALDEGGYYPASPGPAGALAESSGAEIFLTVGRLEHTTPMGTTDPLPQTFFVAAFTHGGAPAVASDAAREWRYTAADKLGRHGALGVGRRHAISSIGVGQIGDNFDFGGGTFAPVWRFEGGDLPMPRSLNTCRRGTGALDLENEVMAVTFVTHYPPAELEVTAPTAGEAGATGLTDSRALRPLIRDGRAGDGSGGGVHETYIRVKELEMGRLQATRLQLMEGGRLRVTGDIRVPALRVNADRLYIRDFSIRRGTDNPRFGLLGPAATPADFSAGDNLRDTSPYEANRTVIDALRVGAGFERRSLGPISPAAARSGGHALTIRRACGTVNTASGDDNACPAVNSVNSN